MDTPRKATGGLLAAAIISIIGGSTLLLFSLCGGVSLASMPALSKLPGPGGEPARQLLADPIILGFSVGGLLVVLTLNVLPIVTGVLLLKLRPAARWVGNIYGVTHLLYYLIYTPVNLLYIQPRLQADLPATPFNTAGFQIGSAIGGTIVFNVLALALLILLNRASVREQLRAAP